MANTECEENIKKDIQKETIDAVLKDLKSEIKSLEYQDLKIQCTLDEENKKGLEMKRLLRARKPFSRTKTGELIFPGKKEMEFKLSIMMREIMKLKTVLNGFEEDRCRINLAQEIIDANENIGDNAKKQLIKELDKTYNNIKNEFDNKMLEVSKYRVKLDAVKKESDINDRRLEKTQFDFDEAIAQLEKTELFVHGESEKKKELEEAQNRLNDLKPYVDKQMNELDEKNKSYMSAIHEKEYQIIRAKSLCKEKAKLTTEFDSEFNRVNEYFKSRFDDIKHLPTVLQAVQGQLAAQKELKIAVEKIIETLSRKLKTLSSKTDGSSINQLKQLEKLKAKHISLKNEQEKTQKILSDLQQQHSEIKQNINQQKSRLEDIKVKTSLKLTKYWRILNELIEEYLHTIDNFQNQVSKLEAYSCFEEGKLKLASSMMQNQIDNLSNVLKDSQKQITKIENLQKYLAANENERFCDTDKI